MTDSKIFNPVDNKVDFIQIEHDMLKKWNKDDTFNQLRKKTLRVSPGHFSMDLLLQIILWVSIMHGVVL